MFRSIFRRNFFFYPSRRIYLYMHILFTIAILYPMKTAVYLLLIFFSRHFSVSRKKLVFFFIVYDFFHS